MKQKLQTLLKHELQWLVLLASLLGVSQGVWAGAGSNWFDLTFTGASTTQVSGYNNGNFSSDLGELKITSSNALKISEWHCYWYKDGSGNVCGSGKLYWRIGTSGSFTPMDQGSWIWNTTTTDCKYNNITQCNCSYKTSANTTVFNSSTPGNYTLQFYFMASGNASSTSSCGDLYNSNNSKNYSVTFTVPGISVQPSTTGQSLCKNGSATALSVTAVGSSPSYQWQSATTSGGTYSNISGATSSSYTPPTGTVGTKYYRCKVTISGTTYTSNASGAIVVKDNPSLTSVTGPTELTASTNPAGTYTTQSIANATYTWSTTLTSSSGLNSSTSNSVTAYTGATTQSGKKVSVYATKDGCKSNTVELTGISVVASCTTPSASDIGISAPASATTIYLGEGSEPSVNQALTATCSKGNTYQWSATPTTYLSSSCWPGTATRVSIANSDKTSATATFYHEGEYTATFKAGCSNTTDASKPAPKITVKPGHIYFDGPFFSGSNYDLTKHHLEIDKSNDEFVYEWTATSSNTVAKNDFIISVGNRCINATTSAYDIGNYADLTLNGLVIPDKDTSDNTNCNHNFRANIGTINVGDRLKLTVTYNGVNASNKPQYAVKLEKVCSNPTAQTVSGTATICDGSSTNVTVASSQSGYTYKLYKGGSATATTQTGSTGSALNFPVSDAGTYTVHAYYTSGSDDYCKADMDGSATVTVDATSVAGTISGRSSSQCLGNTRTLTLKNYTGTIQWHVGNAGDFTPSSSTAISGATSEKYYAPISEVGTKYYKAVVTNGVCPAATTTTAADITVNRQYQASDFNLSGNTQYYDGDPKPVTVAEKSGAGNGAITIKYAGSTTAPTNAGTYAITINVDKSTTSPYYCPASDLSVGTLTINKANQSTVSITNAGIYCAGSEVTALATGGSGTGSYSFARVSGTSGITINTSTGAITASNAGTITVNATRAGDANYNPSAASSNVTFTFSEGPAKFTLTAAGGTTICSAGGKLRLSGSESGFSYQLYKNGSAYGSPVAGTGSAIEFDVFESGDYVCRAYLTSSPSCYTVMTGEVTLHISLTPTLIPATPTVTSYTPVTITSINTDILTWEISGEGNTAYLYDKTSNTVKVKASAAGSPYTITATTSGGCSQTATLTVNADVEVCN